MDFDVDNLSDHCKEWYVENGHTISDSELHDDYDDFLNYINDTVIGSTSYAELFKQHDTASYRCGFVGWLDGEIRAKIYVDLVQGEYGKVSDLREEFDSYKDDFEEDVLGAVDSLSPYDFDPMRDDTLYYDGYGIYLERTAETEMISVDCCEDWEEWIDNVKDAITADIL